MLTEKKKNEIIQKYINEMEIIKLRVEQIRKAKTFFAYLEPAAEFKALQLRKIIEQILLASLVANAEEYKKFYNKIGSEWNARLICRDIARVNADYFPRAVINNHDKMEISNVPDSMKEDELIAIYEKMGKLLHSANPFSVAPDYEKMNEFIDESCRKIIKLLSTHTIHLVGGDAFLFVIMNCSDRNGHVAINWFERCD